MYQKKYILEINTIQTNFKNHQASKNKIDAYRNVVITKLPNIKI